MCSNIYTKNVFPTMNFLICFGFVYFIYFTECRRRIINGVVPHEDKPFVVYLLQTERAKTNYDAWICGGSLVTNKHLITSAACLEDVQSIYVIAGYKKYVTTKNIFKDECTKRVRNKIIKSCTPKYFELDYNNFTKWVTLDIAVAFVQKPYNFTDPVFTKYCSYAPGVIGINYDKNNEFGGAIIYGWGHEKIYRMPQQKDDLNAKTMHYTAVGIVNKTICTKAYSLSPGMLQVIPKYMICSLGRGGVNDVGKRIVNLCNRRNDKDCIQVLRESLDNGQPERRTPIGIAISGSNKRNATFYPPNITRTRNNKLRNNRETTTTESNVKKVKTNNSTTKTNTRAKMEGNKGRMKSLGHSLNLNSSKMINISMIPHTNEMLNVGRRVGNANNAKVPIDYGPCQNDHGGPISSFIGRYEVLLGVQSAFVLDKNYRCQGPFVYTSAASVKDFINCIIFKGTLNEKAGIDCKNPKKLGFDYEWHFDTKR